MCAYQKPNTVKIVYFSGTGGTTRISALLAAALESHGVSVRKFELNNRESDDREETDLLILLYPVYALNAPEPVYEYIQNLPTAKNIPAAVLSVSGGGEVTPNTACRVSCIKQLEKKGYVPVYEKMLVMPSNIFTQTPELLAVRLLEVLPEKVAKIAEDLVSGVNCRTSPKLIDRFLAQLAKLEQMGGPMFGKSITPNTDCTGCGLCAKSCPRGNIVLQNHVPVFDGKCVICLKCIYSCPQKALSPKAGKFMLVKQGYDLKLLENRVSSLDDVAVKKLTKGPVFSGVKKYLLED